MITWIKNNISQLKTLLIVLLVIAFFISLLFNNIGNKRVNILKEKFAKLELLNSELQEKQKEYEELYKIIELEKQVLEKEYNSLVEIKQKLENENKILKNKIGKIPTWVFDIPIDSSYLFLKTTAYPFDGELKYPFNETQVRNIHINYVENIQYEDLITVQDSQLLNYKGIETVLLTVNNNCNETIGVLQDANKGLAQMYENEQEKTKLCEKEFNKQNKKRNLWRMTTGVVSAIAIVLLII